MTFDLNNFSSFDQYFASIAQKNKQLSGYIFGDVEVGQGESAEWKGKKLWAWPPTTGTLTTDDNYFLKRRGTLWIGGAPASEKQQDQDLFYQQCEVIAKQIVSKMILDKVNAAISCDFSRFTFDRGDMFFGSTKFIGCELNIWFDDPDGFEYNENDWNP